MRAKKFLNLLGEKKTGKSQNKKAKELVDSSALRKDVKLASMIRACHPVYLFLFCYA